MGVRCSESLTDFCTELPRWADSQFGFSCNQQWAEPFFLAIHGRSRATSHQRIGTPARGKDRTMLQVIMLVVGVWYVFELLTIGSSGLKLGLPPEILVEWRAQRKKQYLWGIAAGWGSLVAGILTSVGMTPSYPTTTDVARAQLSMIVVTAIVLIGCLVVSIAASKKAKSFEQKWTSLGYGMPGAYPPAANQPRLGLPRGWDPDIGRDDSLLPHDHRRRQSPALNDRRDRDRFDRLLSGFYRSEKRRVGE